jgi:GT2 family glycosyltransferase
MKVNIITVLYNSSHCFNDYFKLISNAGYHFNLILVDNASNPKEKEIYKNYLTNYKNFYCDSINIITNEKNVMFTPAANTALRFSRADYYLLLNPDTFLVESQWLAKMIKSAREHNSDVSGFKLVDKLGMINHAGGYSVGDPMVLQNNIHRGYGMYQGFNKSDKPDWVTGGCMLISDRAIKQVGVLPIGEQEQYKHYHSDRVYCQKVRNMGLNVWYLPICIGHLHGGSTK